jgi:hypothetical protein
MSENTKNISTDAKATPSKDWLGGPQNGAVTSNADANQDLKAAMEKIVLICVPLLQSGHYQGQTEELITEVFGIARQLSGQNV